MTQTFNTILASESTTLHHGCRETLFNVLFDSMHILANILAAFRNLAPNADIKAFVRQWFSDPAQDLEAWTPTDWQEK